MTNPQFTRGFQLNHVAAIDVHHAAQFRDDDSQEAVEIDGVREGHREAIDNAFTRLVHLDLAFERKRLCAVGHLTATEDRRSFDQDSWSAEPGTALVSIMPDWFKRRQAADSKRCLRLNNLNSK